MVARSRRSLLLMCGPAWDGGGLARCCPFVEGKDCDALSARDRVTTSTMSHDIRAGPSGVAAGVVVCCCLGSWGGVAACIEGGWPVLAHCVFSRRGVRCCRWPSSCCVGAGWCCWLWSKHRPESLFWADWSEVLSTLTSVVMLLPSSRSAMLRTHPREVA